MIFEHLYVEYLYLKYPVAKPIKKSNKPEGKKEGKRNTPSQETDMDDLILQSNAKESPSPKTRKGGARILIGEEAKVDRKNLENRMDSREGAPDIVKRVGSLGRDQLLKKKF